MKTIDPAALKAATEIADQFKSGFVDDRMVADFAVIIQKHMVPTKVVTKDCVNQTGN